MFIDPEHKRTHELKAWYARVRANNIQLNSVTGGVAAALNGGLAGILAANGCVNN